VNSFLVWLSMGLLGRGGGGVSGRTLGESFFSGRCCSIIILLFEFKKNVIAVVIAEQMFILNFMLYPPGIQHEARFSVFQWDALLD
jgi:hypothetical protein